MPSPKAVRNYASVLRAVGFSTRESGRLIGIRVINKTGVAISADKLVAISGYDVTSKLPKVVLADADGADLATDVYVALAAISDGKTATVYKGGNSAATLNTNFGTVGDPVFLDIVAGAFTGTQPTALNARVQVVGYTMVKSATVGQIKWDIKPPTKFASNDVQQASGRTVAATTAVASVATVTPAADGSFDVCMNVLVTTSTTHTFTAQCTYTDEGNTGRTITMPFRLVGSTTGLISSIADGGTAVPYIGVPVRIRVKAATAITLLTQAAGTYTTVTYNVEGTIKQVA